MKRFILVPAILLFLVFPALAQVKVGVKAGGNYSNATIPNFQQFNNPEFKTGFHAGVFLIIPAGKELYVKQELFYNVKGWRNTDSLGVEKVHLKYLSQTLLLGIKATSKLALIMGPEVGYLLDVAPKVEAYIPEADILNKESFNRFEAGLVGGLAYKVLENLTMEARYSQGLTDLFDWRMLNYPYYYKGGNNNAFQVSVNYILSKNQNL